MHKIRYFLHTFVHTPSLEHPKKPRKTSLLSRTPPPPPIRCRPPPFSIPPLLRPNFAHTPPPLSPIPETNSAHTQNPSARHQTNPSPMQKRSPHARKINPCVPSQRMPPLAGAHVAQKLLLHTHLRGLTPPPPPHVNAGRLIPNDALAGINSVEMILESSLRMLSCGG